jgi:steroid delta-isomerase
MSKRSLARTLIYGITMLAWLASAALAQSTDAAEAAIRKALTQWMADFNTRNTRTVCDLFAPDLRFDYQGVSERGYRAICDQLQHALNDPKRTYNYALDIKEILVSGDLAVVRLVWTLKVSGNGVAKETVSEETGMDVFRQRPNGSWKIIRFIAYEAPS